MRKSAKKAPEIEIPPPEQVVDGYRLLREMESGARSVVYEAEQVEPLRHLALELFQPGQVTLEQAQRFVREAPANGGVKHAGIAEIFEAGRVDVHGSEHVFVTTQFVDGVELRAQAKRKLLNGRDRLAVLATICDAVHHANEAGVVHRALEPRNVRADEAGSAVVFDFGGAFAAPGVEASRELGAGAYGSPEEWGGGVEAITALSNVYSLGVIGFELVSGELPLDPQGLSVAAARKLIATHAPKHLGALKPKLRGDVETILGKALEKQPKDRYESAAALAEDIRRFLRDRPIHARRPSTVERLVRFVRRRA